MTGRPPREKRDPLARKKARHTAPTERSRAMCAMSARAAQGRFVLQFCDSCNKATYPPRDVCPLCWGELAWQDCERGALVLSATTIRTSTDLYFRDHMPWRMGSVSLDAGPVALAHLHRNLAPEDRAEIHLMLDRGGNAALFALPAGGDFDMTDPQLREFVVPLRGATVLVTDARSAIGEAVVKALHAAGAGLIVAGLKPPNRAVDGGSAVLALDGVQPVPLDIVDAVSLSEALSKIGGPLDIVINTARYVRQGSIGHGNLVEQRRAFDISALGFARLARACAPMLAGRPAGAFLDVVSIDALGGNADRAANAAAEAARLSLQQSFRHEMRAVGVRVMSVFVGPTDDEHHQAVPPPKVAPDRLAQSIVQALEQGREQTSVGDIAVDAMERWLADPALYTRENNL